MASLLRKSILLIFLFLFLLIHAFAESRDGSESYKKGKAEYDAGRYEQAIPLFEKCIQENKQDYAGKGNYMIALCYIKLGKCEKTKPYFKAAYQADPINGGASTKEKFKAKLKSCKLTIEDLAMTDLTNSSKTTASKSSEKPDNAVASLNNPTHDDTNASSPDNSGSMLLMVFLTLAGMIVVVYFIVRYMNNSQGTRIGSNQNRKTVDRTNISKSSVRYSGSRYSRSSSSDLTNDIANAILSNEYNRTDRYHSHGGVNHSRDNS
jgi:tetratricopeptide (TPR) repeat protein